MTTEHASGAQATPPPVLHWFLPTGGDGRSLASGSHGTTIGGRPNTPQAGPGGSGRSSLAYLTQVAVAAEELGFTGVLTPTGAHCQDAWLVTSALVTATSRLRFLVAVRPGLVAPLLTAQMAATLQTLSSGRLMLNVVVGGDPVELPAYGDEAGHDDRYERAEELLGILAALWRGEVVEHSGPWFRAFGARLPAALATRPPIYVGGASPAALRLASSSADVFLSWCEPVEVIAERVLSLRALDGGKPAVGIRAHVVARPTSDEAWAAADRLLEGVDDDTIALAGERLSRFDSVGQRRMVDLSRDTQGLVVGPNLWAGVGLVRGGAGLALVGSYAEVAQRIREYQAAGVDEFVLSGYPHLEKAYHVGEGVLPLLR